MGVGNQNVLDDPELLVKSERPRQTAFEIGVLLPLVQIAAEDRILFGNPVVNACLKIVRLGEIDAALLAEILIGKYRRVAEIGIRPEGQIKFGDAIDTALWNGV